MKTSYGAYNYSRRGRPKVITLSVVAILRRCFEQDYTVEEACRKADISKDAYYDKRKKDPKFSDEMDKAQSVPFVIAKNMVLKKIKQGDGNLALRFLERRQPERYRLRQESELEPQGNYTIVLPGSKPHPRFVPPRNNE